MTDKELFIHIKKSRDYKTVGLDVQYKIEINKEDGFIYLVFEESTSKQDWKINLDWPAQVYRNQQGHFYIHRGYIKSWKSCNDLIMADFIKTCREYPNFIPIICGWSYGGAMAILAAEDYHYRSGRYSELITFGAPKIVYGSRSKKHMQEAIFSGRQWANINDFVTWCVLLPFVHHIEKRKCGGHFSIKKIIHTEYTHTHYEDFING